MHSVQRSDMGTVADKFYQELYTKVDILYFFVSTKGVVKTVNAAATDVLNKEPAGIVEKPFYHLFIPEEHELIRDQFSLCLRKGYLKNIEATLNCGSRFLRIKIHAMRVNNNRGEPRGIRFYGQNIEFLNHIMGQRDVLMQALQLTAREFLTQNDVSHFLENLRHVFTVDGIGLFLNSQFPDAYQSVWLFDNDNPLLNRSALQNLTFDQCKTAYHHFPAELNAVDAKEGILVIKALAEHVKYLKFNADLNEALMDYQTLCFTSIILNGETVGYLILVKSKEMDWRKDLFDILETVPQIVKKVFHQNNEIEARPNHPLSTLKQVTQIGILSVAAGKIVFCNDWVSVFLGYSPEELIGKGLKELIVAEYSDAFLATSYNETQESELAIYKKDGSHLWVSCQYVFASDDAIDEVWYIYPKENRSRLNRKLIEAKKMESVGMLAGSIVHDFKNLMAGIQGYASLLVEDFSSDSPYYEDVKQIQIISNKAIEQSTRLMAHAEGASYIVDDLNINQLIKEVAGMLSRTVSNNISIRAELDPALKSIRGDASALQQMILQLALNARDAMKKGGKLIFQTKNVVLKDNDRRLPDDGEPGDYVQISINDTGHGIARDLKEHIYKPEFTTRSENSHFGLGLTLVEEIVSKHGAALSVFSERQQGSVFRLYLPARSEKKPAAEIHEKLQTGHETVLLIEQNKLARETVRKMLTRYGYAVICSEHISDAMVNYNKSIDRIALIMLDLAIPDLNVNAVLEKIRRENPEVKILLTGYNGEKRQSIKGIHQNCDGYLEKPYQIRPLLVKLKSVLHP